MKPETINEIRRALNNSNLWFYDPETNALFVQPEKLMYKAVAFPPELQSSIPAACVLLQHAPALLDEIERLQAELKRWTGVFTGVTPEDMRRRMMDMSVAHAWLSEENFRLTAYVAELEEKLETTRMQLAACDVVANSNTTDDLEPACPAFVAREEAQPHKCAWRQDEYTGAYHTACGHLWEFTEGGLVDNDTRYCPYCGGQIVEQPTEGEENDE